MDELEKQANEYLNDLRWNTVRYYCDNCNFLSAIRLHNKIYDSYDDSVHRRVKDIIMKEVKDGYDKSCDIGGRDY